MLRLIVVQLVSIIPFVQFSSSWGICFIGCKQPLALFDLSSRSCKSSLDNHSDSFSLVEFLDLNRLWVSLSAVMSPSFPTATCPNPPTHTVSFPARLLHRHRTFSSSDCQIRLHVFLLFYCGLKSPGINSALSPAPVLCRYLTGPILLLLLQLHALYFFIYVFPPCHVSQTWKKGKCFCSISQSQVSITLSQLLWQHTPWN